jgi:hypothetical protein
MHAPAESKITNLDLDKPSVRVRIPSACYDVGPLDLGPVSFRVFGTRARDYMATRSTVISDHCVMLSGCFQLRELTEGLGSVAETPMVEDRSQNHRVRLSESI